MNHKGEGGCDSKSGQIALSVDGTVRSYITPIMKRQFSASEPETESYEYCIPRTRMITNLGDRRKIDFYSTDDNGVSSHI